MHGGIAQLGEHLLCKQGVVGSIPSTSTTTSEIKRKWQALGCDLCDHWLFLFFNNLEEVVKIYQSELRRCDDVSGKTGGL